jgi:hypothetical protein
MLNNYKSDLDYLSKRVRAAENDIEKEINEKKKWF